MLTRYRCDKLSLQSLVEPAVVDLEPAVFRTVEDVCVALPKTNSGIIVGLSRVDGLRRNYIVSGHHYHQRNVGCSEVFGVEAVERALLVKDMVERPAQRERGVLVSHQRQFVEPPKRRALQTHLVPEQPQFGGGIADDVVTLVDEANHQRRLAFMA